MVRLRSVLAVLLVSSPACIFPLSPDPTGDDEEPEETTAAATTSESEPTTTGGVDPAPTTTSVDPTTGGPNTSTTSPTSDSGEPETTGWPDDDKLEPLVTEVWDFEAMDLGDVDGDGRLDLVTSGTGAPPRVTVYPGRGDGTFDREAAVDTTVYSFSGFVVADVTGDGHADVLAHGTGAPPRITVFAGHGDLGFTELATTQVFEFTHMHASDMNADGKADLLIGDGNTQFPWVQVWPGTSDGIVDKPLFSGDPWRFDLLRTGDVDGDGKADLVTASAGFPPQLYVHSGDGAGGFGEPVISAIFNLSWFDLGDVDGDGRADAATDIPNNAWRFQIYQSTGDGWSESVAYDGFNFDRFELGDVDGDGKADLVTRATGAPPRVAVYLASTL